MAESDNIDYDLIDFVEINQLPATFKITSGHYSRAYEFSIDDVYMAERVDCTDITLEYINKSNDLSVRQQVNKDFILKFNITQYISNETNNVYRTVSDLRHICPFYVQCGREYKNPSHPKDAFRKGQILRLMRFIKRNEEMRLECHSVKDSKLIYLPMNCRGDFKAICNSEEYTVADLVNIFKRRCPLVLKLSSHPVNMIHGHIIQAKCDIVKLLPPKYDVVLSRVDSPGSADIVPLDITLSVTLRDDDYTSRLEVYYDFDRFIRANASLMPFVVKICDWSDTSNLFECHGIKLGLKLHVLSMTEITKTLAYTDDCYIAIPDSNETKFALLPKVIKRTEKLIMNAPCTVRITELSSAKYNHYLEQPLHVGDLIHIPSPKTQIKTINGYENETLQMDILDEGKRITKTVFMPIFMDFVFEEETSSCVVTGKHAKGIDSPVQVRLLAPDTDCAFTNDAISKDDKVTLICSVREDSALVSTDYDPSTSFNLPLRDCLKVVLDKSITPIKRARTVSVNDRCIEILSQDTFLELYNSGNVYDSVQALPPFSRISVISSSEWQSDIRLPPIHDEYTEDNSDDKLSEIETSDDVKNQSDVASVLIDAITTDTHCQNIRSEDGGETSPAPLPIRDRKTRRRPPPIPVDTQLNEFAIGIKELTTDDVINSPTLLAGARRAPPPPPIAEEDEATIKQDERGDDDDDDGDDDEDDKSDDEDDDDDGYIEMHLEKTLPRTEIGDVCAQEDNPPPIPQKNIELAEDSPDPEDYEDPLLLATSLPVPCAVSAPQPRVGIVLPTVQTTVKPSKNRRSFRFMCNLLKKKSKQPQVDRQVSLGDPSREVRIPDDHNLNGFSVGNMAVLLRTLSVSSDGCEAVLKHSIDGKRFGLLSDEELVDLRLNNDFVRLLRDKTKRAAKAATLPAKTKF